jgi:hypothetical protein
MQVCVEYERVSTCLLHLYDCWNEFLLIRCVDYVELPFGRDRRD